MFKKLSLFFYVTRAAQQTEIQANLQNASLQILHRREAYYTEGELCVKITF